MDRMIWTAVTGMSASMARQRMIASNMANADSVVSSDGKPYRGMRGVNWYNGENGHSRVSNRNPSYFRGPQDPDHAYYHIGFRVVLGNQHAQAAQMTLNAGEAEGDRRSEQGAGFQG